MKKPGSPWAQMEKGALTDNDVDAYMLTTSAGGISPLERMKLWEKLGSVQENHKVIQDYNEQQGDREPDTGMVLRCDDELVKQPNGSYKLVRTNCRWEKQ